MDDEKKTVTERFTDVVKSLVDTASNAAKDALKPDPENVAATSNERVYIPEGTDAAATPVPLFARRKKRGFAPVNKPTAKSKKAAPKRAKKSAKKTAGKASKKTKKAAAKKTAKKISKKKAAKRRR
jgi:hypothetical protein